jgi:tetratricopeptide (TPR) repeat protein
MRFPKFFLLLFVALCLAEKLLGQSVRWDPPGGQLGFNQVSELALVFENCEPDGDLQIPAIAGLQIGNNPGRSTSIQSENFSNYRKTFTLTFPVRPNSRNPITIPAFEIQTDKGKLTVAAARFTVGDTPVGQSGLSINDIAAATLEAPKQSYWAGEVFPVTYSLNILRRYYHSLATNVTWGPAPLVAEDWSKPEPSEALLQGERRVVSIQSTRAYSRQPGSFSLKPASQMVNLMVGTTGFGFFSQPSVEQRQIDTKSLDVTIKPLPAAPADFSGAVGEFAFVSKVVPTTAAVGEPITWTLELTGTGNWPDIAGLPQRKVSNDFQIVQPKSKRTMKEGALFEGSLSEDVVLVPTRAGSYELAPVRFTYFDPKSGSYKTITSAPVTVMITAGATSSQPSAGSNAPIQFSLPTSSEAPTIERPAPVAPVAPDELPRETIKESATGFVPLAMRPLLLFSLLAGVLVPLIVWLIFAALRSQQRDAQRHRREALSKLSAALAELRQTPTALPAAIRAWQQNTVTVWSIPHAAPSASQLHQRIISTQPEAADTWLNLWNESDRALHGRDATLPSDWVARAESAAHSVKVPGWSPFTLFAPRNLFPFFFALSLALLPLTTRADAGNDAYQRGDFSAAEAAWTKSISATPNDWAARHNLGLALAQQDRWAEAAAHWTSAFLLNSRDDATRYSLALGLQRSGIAPLTLVELSRGNDLFAIVRLATPGEWQLVLVVGALLLAASLVLMLLKGYQRAGSWAWPAALTTCLVAVVLTASATFSLQTYDTLAKPSAIFVWKASVLHSIPTEADTTQQTSPLSAGSIAVAEKTFLGWTKLNFSGGQTGWVRSEDLIRLYR